MKKSKKIIIISSSAVLVFLVLIFTLGAMASASSNNTIYNGIYINNINVGGLTREEAVNLLNDKFNAGLKTKKLNLVYENQNLDIYFDSLDAHYNVDEAVDKAITYGKNENLFKKTLLKWKLSKSEYGIDMNFIYNAELIKNEVEKIAKNINIEPVDAKLKYNGSTFTVTPDIKGRNVNEDELNTLIKTAVESNNEAAVNIPVNTLEAKVNKELMSKVNTKLASFTTAFKPSDVNRTTNVKLAANAVNGVLIMPGDTFSMNKALGPRTEAKGYKDALIIVGGKVEPGLAGGICQVTTTVYNAALLSNMQILERKPHALVVTYVAPGRDATISGDYIDLKFKNTYNFPIYIETVVKNSSLTVNFYGDKEYANQRVEIASEVYEHIKPNIQYINDSNLAQGREVVLEKPVTGTKSKTYKRIYVNNKLVKTEIVSQDIYRAVDGKVAVGAKPLNNPPITNPQNGSATETPAPSDNTAAGTGTTATP